MVQVVDLYKVQYLTGRFETVDAQSIASMVLKRYHKNMVMDKDSDSIRNEDVRIEFNRDIQNLASLFCKTWEAHYPDQPIELCWNSTIKEDPNTALIVCGNQVDLETSTLLRDFALNLNVPFLIEICAS